MSELSLVLRRPLLRFRERRGLFSGLGSDSLILLLVISLKEIEALCKLLLFLERGEDFARESLTVRINFPMPGAPAFEEAVEVRPGDGIERAPFLFDRARV